MKEFKITSYICSYCNHRLAVPHLGNTRRHMKSCSARNGRDSEPTKFTNLEKLLSFPRFKKGKLNDSASVNRDFTAYSI